MGHGLSVAQRNREAAQKSFRERMSVTAHYGHMNAALHAMHVMASTEGEIDSSMKDRFSMYASIVDKHWRVVEKYLPPMAPTTGTGTPTATSSMLSTLVASLLAPKHSADTASNPGNERVDAVVSTNLEHDDSSESEKGG